MSHRHDSDATTPLPTGPPPLPPTACLAVEPPAPSSAPAPPHLHANHTAARWSPFAIVPAVCGALIESLRYIFSRRSREERDD